MAKPWVRFQQNFINHPKFIGLDGNAIGLWLEGKNYCDMQQTEGVIPKAALKAFRFTSRRAVDQLTASCGTKPDGTPYAPLWGTHGAIAFSMHDYLDHNDSSQVVKERIGKADKRRADDAERKRLARAAKDAARNPVSAGVSAECPQPNPQNVGSITETQTQTETLRPSDGGGGRRRDKAPPLTLGLRRLKVWRWMLDDLIATLGSHAEAFDIELWLQALDARETRVIADSWPWLKDELIAEAKRRGLPLATTSAPDGRIAFAAPRECPHDPPCENGPNWQCHQRTELDRVKAAGA